LYEIVLGELDPNDKTILVNWYSALGFSTLNWNASNLCGEPEITCDSLSPQRLVKLYVHSF